MSLARMSRMCESLENVSPTKKRHIICATLSHFSDKATAVKILSREYEVNNIGEKKAIKWLAKIFDVFEDEIEDSSYTWMDLGEGMNEFLSQNRPDSNISLKETLQLLELDCANITSNSFQRISDAISRMSALEVKWFIRYWLRTPRNGINNSTMGLVLQDYYSLSKEDRIRYCKTNTMSTIAHHLDNDRIPPSLVHGSFVKPMLAKKYLGKLPNNFIMDIKYDGNRYQIHIDPQGVIIFNRKGKIVTDQYPDVVESLLADIDNKSEGTIIDCEIYPIDSNGNPKPHQTLATRVHSKDKQKAISECQVSLVVFDCLLHNGVSTLDDSYRERLACLESILPSRYLTQQFTHGNIEAAYNVAINSGFEGIMIKDQDAPYESKRTSALLKYKPPRVELDVVITSGQYGNGKRAGVLATYGVSVKSETGFTSIGNVGSGISEVEMDKLSVRLKNIVDSYANNVYHVLPRIVLEVTCDDITRNQDGTFGMRFPRILRIRDDKHAADCNTLADIEEMCSNIY